ncbi:MAG TPA: hypothetical protein VFD32_24365 [Dehalococcoidia bacterium]|nr:hypothetical protein [Dehalococcoidia bacterium]
MPLLYEAHCTQRAHAETVDRINRSGYRLAYREEAARLLQAEQIADRPVRRNRGSSLLHGLRRLRFA